MHEGECNENAQSALEQKFNPDQIHEVIVEETSEHVDDHMLPIETGASLGTYAPLKFSVSQLDTHEIIIETSR